MIYALINTMSAMEGSHKGRILSYHRTADAADRANARIQRLTRKSNGDTSYLPTIIRPMSRRSASSWAENHLVLPAEEPRW